MLGFLFFALVAASSPPTGEPFHTDKSPSGTIVAEHFIFEVRDPRWETPRREIWLRDMKGKSPPTLLFEHYRDAKVLFSPNEKWIVIDDNFGSSHAEVRLFQQVNGLKYQEMGKVDATAGCWALLDRTFKRPVSSELDHIYINAARWAPDSRALLLVAWGYVSGEPLKVDDWLCVFDVERVEASTDMGLMNRGAVDDRRKSEQ